MEVSIEQGYFDGLMSTKQSMPHDLKDPKTYKYFLRTAIPWVGIYHRGSDIHVDVSQLTKAEFIMFLELISTQGGSALKTYRQHLEWTYGATQGDAVLKVYSKARGVE